MANTIGVGSNQTANGLSGPDSIFGTGGPSLNDIIYGRMGDDTINGQPGAAPNVEIDLSSIYGGQGNDLIFVNNFDKVYGNLGNDVIQVFTSSTAYGGQGNDEVVAMGANSLAYGNLGDDAVFLDGAQSSAYGGQGNDTILGMGGTDLIHGNVGDDEMVDFVGNSTLFGDGGNDIVEGTGPDVLYGNLGNDTLAGGTNATLFGGQGDDVAEVFGTNNLVYGNFGNDLLVDVGAPASGSSMFGGQGNDAIVSEVANNDVMSGGLGSDLFVDSYGTTAATHTTTVSDFVTGTDQVSFGSGAGIGATTPAPSGDSTNFVAAQDNTVTNATLAATTAATAEAGNTNIHYAFVAGATDGYLFYDGAGGTGAFNAEITLTGQNSITSLSANDITGSTADAGIISDVRAKRDITLLGRLAIGLNLYRYRYTWSDEVYVGVMAQEVATVRPDAVVRGPDGMLRVIYERLGLKMQTWSQWTAARA